MVQQTTDTPDWQGPAIASASSAPATAILNLAHGVTSHFVSGLTGKTILLYGFTLLQKDSSNAIINIQGTDGTVIFTYVCQGNGTINIPLYGIKLGVGTGVDIVNTSGTNMATFDTYHLVYQVQ